MIRRLVSLAHTLWAVAGRSKTIQDLVARVWPRASAPTARTGDAAGTAGEPVASFAPPASAPAAVAAAPTMAALTAAEPEPAAVRVEPNAADAPVAQPLEADAEAEPVVAANAASAAVEDETAEAQPAAALVPLRPLGSKEAMDGSVWVPRILWALEFAKLRELGPQSASDISRVLTEHSGLNVPSPNVARAFRDRKQQGASYWKEVEGQRYEISRAGSVALRKQLRSSDN